jgi:hypothetical protein
VFVANFSQSKSSCARMKVRMVCSVVPIFMGMGDPVYA